MLVSDDLEKDLVRSSESQFWDTWIIILGAEKEASQTRGEKHIEGRHADNSSLVHEDMQT
jgi:hypothetical protein